MAAWPAPSMPPAGALTLRFVAIEAPLHAATPADSRLELGAMTARASPRGISVRKRIGLRLDGPQPTARVSVRLASELVEGAVRVNGRLLGTAPQVIDAAHRVGVTVAHDIVITVPAHAPPGPLLGNIVWTAEQH